MYWLTRELCTGGTVDLVWQEALEVVSQERLTTLHRVVLAQVMHVEPLNGNRSRS